MGNICPKTLSRRVSFPAVWIRSTDADSRTNHSFASAVCSLQCFFCPFWGKFLPTTVASSVVANGVQWNSQPFANDAFGKHTPGACTMMVAEQTQDYRISFEKNHTSPIWLCRYHEFDHQLFLSTQAWSWFNGACRAGPGQFAALGKILPGAPCLTLVNINQLKLKMNNTFVTTQLNIKNNYIWYSCKKQY